MGLLALELNLMLMKLISLNEQKKVAENVNIPIALVGGIRSKKTIQNILDNTKIEILSLSRPLIYDPMLSKENGIWRY